jgi:hypothetical protein
MLVDVINEDIRFQESLKVLKSVLYLKLLERDIVLTNNELNVLSIVATTSLKQEIINRSLEKKFIKSYQSGENFVSKFIGLDLVKKISSGKVEISREIIPSMFPNEVAGILRIYVNPKN